jgi:hypothetical protein
MDEDEFVGACGMFWGKDHAYVTFFGKNEMKEYQKDLG